MKDWNDSALVPRPPGALEKAVPGAKRILSSMVADVLALKGIGSAEEEWCRQGEACYYGIDVKHDRVEAVKSFRMAADRGHARAQCWLGYCYQNWYQYDRGIEKDLAEGARWFQKAAKQGEAIAQFNLGVCYEGGLGVPGDRDKMVLWYRNAAEQGHVEAHFRLGVRYTTGPHGRPFGENREAREGMTLLERVAEKGHIQSQLRLGFLQGTCCGNYDQKIKWYRMAAQQGDGEGQARLGACYEAGEGVPQDQITAIKWYRMAVEQGDMHGQYALGSCYENGTGVPRNSREATKWYRLAAEQRLAEAQRTLAICYEQGRGVRQNVVEARRWYEEAAEQGDAEAQRRFAGLLIHAYLTHDHHHHYSEWNLIEAYKWLRRATENSDNRLAENKLGELRSSMKPDQLEKGEERFLNYRDEEAERQFLGYQERPFEPQKKTKEIDRPGSLRIVMLDDERFVLSAIRMMLRFDLPNAEILTFTDVEAALEELEQEDPQLFTTDHNHSKLNGTELLRVLAAKQVKYPVFVITAYAEGLGKPTEWLHQFVSQGMQVALLSKPFLLEDLRQLMSKHLGPNYGRA